MPNITLPSKLSFIHQQTQLTQLLAQGSEYLTQKWDALMQKISTLVASIFPAFNAKTPPSLRTVDEVPLPTAKQSPPELPTPEKIKAAVVRAKKSHFIAPEPTEKQREKAFNKLQRDHIKAKNSGFLRSTREEFPLYFREATILRGRQENRTKIGGTDKDTKNPVFKSGNLNKKQFREKIRGLKEKTGQTQSSCEKIIPSDRLTTEQLRDKAKTRFKQLHKYYAQKYYPVTSWRLKGEKETATRN